MQRLQQSAVKAILSPRLRSLTVDPLLNMAANDTGCRPENVTVLSLLSDFYEIPE